jgi:hypothetical protein
MRRSEIADLLAMCAAFDRRTVGEGDVEAWLAVLGDLAFDDCRQAIVKHYAASREWIMPADVRDHATRRLETPIPHESPVPDADPDDVPAYLAALRNGKAMVIEPGPGAGGIRAIGAMP